MDGLEGVPIGLGRYHGLSLCGDSYLLAGMKETKEPAFLIGQTEMEKRAATKTWVALQALIRLHKLYQYFCVRLTHRHPKAGHPEKYATTKDVLLYM